MSRTTLKNIEINIKREQDIKKFKDQRNLVVKSNMKAKRDHLKSIQSISIENEKWLWKTAKPLFTNKNPISEKITLIHGGRSSRATLLIALVFYEHNVSP